MSTEMLTNDSIESRLSTLVTMFAKGSARQFAEQCGINHATMHNYLKGRPPSAEALVLIAKRHGININWLLLGEGAYLIDNDVNECNREHYFVDIQEWLEYLEGEEPDIWAWFKVEFKRKFPEYAEWVKKIKDAPNEASDRRIA